MNEDMLSGITLNTLKLPKQSKWRCYLFGCKPGPGNAYIYTPSEGNEPNWFWRWMQYFAFGNRWVKDK